MANNFATTFDAIFDTTDQLLASVGYTSADLGKIAFINATSMVYRLIAVSPITWIPETSASLTFGSGIPFILPSSGTVNNTVGAITVSSGLDYVVGPSYTFFPLAALYTNSPSGWYYTIWSAATLCVVYADMYISGTPSIPATPTALTTVAGAYTQSTGFDIFGPSHQVPGKFLGANGFIEWNRVINNTSTANNKIYNLYFGGVTFQGQTQTTNPKTAGQGTIKNRGKSNSQIAANASFGDNGNASSLPKLSINTDSTQVFAFALQLATATDYAIIESYFLRLNKV